MRPEFVVSPEWEQRFRAAGWDSFGAVRALGGEKVAKGDRSGVIEVTPPQASGIPPFILKRYHYPFVHMLRTFWISPKARKEFVNLRRARAVGLDTPEPLAYGAHKILGFERESFLLTVRIPGARSLREVRENVIRGKETLPAFPRRRDLIEEFGSQLARFHASGQFHHTLYFKNLLWVQVDGRDRLFAIDNPWGNRWTGRVFFRQAVIRDLACLEKGAKQILPRTDRLRFLKKYLGKKRFEAQDRVLAKRVRELVRKLENDTRMSKFADDFKHYFHGKFYWRTVLRWQIALAALPALVSALAPRERIWVPWPAWPVAGLLFFLGWRLRAQSLRPLPSGRVKQFAKMTDEGIFSKIRQPKYAGHILMVWAACLLWRWDSIFLFACLWTVIVYWGSNHYEERLLRGRFGERFLQYRARVPLFVPKRPEIFM